jgi:hypothetical protein
MTRRGYPLALLLTLTLLAGVGQTAEPEFKVGVVTASRVVEREKGSISVGGVRAGAAKTWISRVTVGVDGMRITGEWEPKTTNSDTAKDFPRGSDVSVAVTRNKLLMKHPDGSIVETRIVRREEAPGSKDQERD